MRRITSLTLTMICLLCLGFMCSTSVYAETYDGLKYRILNNDTIKIYSYIGTKRNISIPDTIRGKKVTRVKAFGEKVQKIKLGRYVENIYLPSFTSSVNALQYISVDKSNKKFSSKNGLLLNKKGNKLIAYPGRLKAKTLMLPKSITYIGSGALMYNDYLEKAVIPAAVKRIGADAFSFCSGLLAVKIPKTVKIIEKNAFNFDTSLEKIDFANDGNYSMQESVFGSCTALNNAVIPKIKYNYSEKYTGDRLYEGCSNVRKVRFCKDAKLIPYKCFENCDNLKSVSLPSSVKIIRKYAFACTDTEYGIDVNYGFIIKGKKGSAAEKYAKANKLKFKAI